MIEIVYEFDSHRFAKRVSELLNEGYKINGAECAKNLYNPQVYPFIYTAILVKL